MTQTPDANLIERLRKVLALTTSPVEGEAMAAAEMLQKLLTDYNLSMADLEARGQDAPGIRKEGHDLGKAAFKWKLTLADVVAEHYYCYPLVDYKQKTVAFVGRPDNVESLQMLYVWLIEQIKRISADERRAHFVRTDEHIDPLRWQVNFGEGAVARLKTRLAQLKAAAAMNNSTTALVLHHKAEISDWLEENMGYRIDGQMTKSERESRAYWAKWDEEWSQKEEAKKARKAELKAAGDLVTLYREFPEEDPKVKAQEEKAREARWKKEERNARRRKGPRYHEMSDEEYTKLEQADKANRAGKEAADQINLQPFLNGEAPKNNPKIGK